MSEIDSYGGLDDGEPPSRLDRARGNQELGVDDDYMQLVGKLRAQQTASDVATDAALDELARARQERHFTRSEYAVRHLTAVADNVLAKYQTGEADEDEVRVERGDISLRRVTANGKEIDDQGQEKTCKSFLYFYSETRTADGPLYRMWSSGDDRVWCTAAGGYIPPYELAEHIEQMLPGPRQKAARFLGRLSWLRLQ